MRINSEVNRANDLMAQIAQLNVDIRHSRISGADASGSENIQSQLIDELAGLIDLQTAPVSAGGVVLRTPDGILLADERGAQIAYNSSASASGFLTITPANSGGQTFDAAFSSGEIMGLVQARNHEVPGVLTQLAEFTSGAAREINRAHNANTAAPAPPSLTGRQMGMDLQTAMSGFSGTTTLALLDSSNVTQHKLAIDFTTGTMTLDGGLATSFTPASFVTTANGLLSPDATFSFTGGTLSVAAASGGVAI